jgi:predicted peptidase
LPLWVFQGEKDVEITKTRELILAVKQNSGHARFTEYAGEGHNVWTRVFKEPEIVAWLFAQSR